MVFAKAYDVSLVPTPMLVDATVDFVAAKHSGCARKRGVLDAQAHVRQNLPPLQPEGFADRIGAQTCYQTAFVRHISELDAAIEQAARKARDTGLIVFVDSCINQHGESLIEGTCISISAAQLFGEPTTQMTLNTFHSACVQEKNLALGMLRAKDLSVLP